MVDHEERIRSNEIVVNRATLQMYQAWAVAATTALITVLIMLITLGREMATRSEMETYINEFGPYVQDKARIDAQLKELARRQDEEIAHSREIERKQQRVLQKLGIDGQ